MKTILSIAITLLLTGCITLSKHDRLVDRGIKTGMSRAEVTALLERHAIPFSTPTDGWDVGSIQFHIDTRKWFYGLEEGVFYRLHFMDETLTTIEKHPDNTFL